MRTSWGEAMRSQGHGGGRGGPMAAAGRAAEPGGGSFLVKGICAGWIDRLARKLGPGSTCRALPRKVTAWHCRRGQNVEHGTRQ